LLRRRQKIDQLRRHKPTNRIGERLNEEDDRDAVIKKQIVGKAEQTERAMACHP